VVKVGTEGVVTICKALGNYSVLAKLSGGARHLAYSHFHKRGGGFKLSVQGNE
jgi:hypothetical protein